MIKISNVKVPVLSDVTLKRIVAEYLKTDEAKIDDLIILKKSIDARKRGSIFYVYSFAVSAKDEDKILKKNIKNVLPYCDKPYRFEYGNLNMQLKPLIIGMGPAGMFCALMLARAGLKPVVIERGEDVCQREKTIKTFWNGGELNENSNVQFGEGGAGTFSDGKLTCGVNDERMDFIIKEFVSHGAPKEIAYAAKPHIGTDYLKIVVENIRKEIASLGGEVRFNTLLTDIEIVDRQVSSAVLKDTKTGKSYSQKCNLLVLAIGHSSRDTYEMLYKKGFKMQKKPFSIGVRIEHKREYINRIQYKDESLAESLPAADYKLSCHPDGRGVYTFCMCPGGTVVCGSSEKGGIVTNGMSYYSRNLENSNSALLVSVRPEDIEGDNPLCAVEFQRNIERKAFECGGRDYYAPCQKADDFINGRKSEKFGDVRPSYKPGVRFAGLDECLPKFVCENLKKALLEFDTKMKGFNLSDALLTGVETRSSAPLRILRDENMCSEIKGVYPIGEGAGYAGGIMSSAADGIKCAESIVKVK